MGGTAPDTAHFWVMSLLLLLLGLNDPLYAACLARGGDLTLQAASAWAEACFSALLLSSSAVLLTPLLLASSALLLSPSALLLASTSSALVVPPPALLLLPRQACFSALLLLFWLAHADSMCVRLLPRSAVVERRPRDVCGRRAHTVTVSPRTPPPLVFTPRGSHVACSHTAWLPHRTGAPLYLPISPHISPYLPLTPRRSSSRGGESVAPLGCSAFWAPKLLAAGAVSSLPERARACPRRARAPPEGPRHAGAFFLFAAPPPFGRTESESLLAHYSGAGESVHEQDTVAVGLACAVACIAL